MKLNKNELKKILCDYNSICNRLLRAEYHDYLGVLKKFLTFLKDTELIYDYIVDCGKCELNIEKEISIFIRSRRGITFPIGNTRKEEVVNIFYTLEYIANQQLEILIKVAHKFSLPKTSQDILEGFNKRFVFVLIDHIKVHLTKIGVDMGLDENTVYNVTIQNGQVNIANDSSIINANNKVEINVSELHRLIENVKKTSTGLSKDDSETLSDCLQAIENQSSSPVPQKSTLKIILKQLSSLATIKSGTEFSAAALTLCDYARKFFNLFN